jgi:hypothetical protein
MRFGFNEIVVKEIFDLDRRGAMASTWADGNTIEIQSSLPDNVKVKVLFNSLHYLVNQISVPHLETDVRVRISRMVYCVLRENPDLAMLRELNDVYILTDCWHVVREKEHYGYSAYKDECNHNLHVNGVRSGNAWFQSLLHEVYHVVFDILVLTYDDTDELENTIDTLAWHLTLLLSQNDMNWLVADVPHNH